MRHHRMVNQDQMEGHSNITSADVTAFHSTSSSAVDEAIEMHKAAVPEISER
jgi:hypothetical protein